jgi:hypothetical protein
LAMPAEDVQDIDKLTPQPYQVPTQGSGSIKPPWTDLLLKAGLPLLILIPIVLALIYWFWLAPPSVPVVPLAERVMQWLDSHAGVLECAKVTKVDVQAGLVSLGGRVASEAQAAEIRKGVQSIEKGIQVKDAFQIIPQPLCAVLDLLEPIKRLGEAQASGLIANLNKQGSGPLYGNPVYFEGENLIVTVKTPATFESYIYVDYYTAEGMVGHLFPNPNDPIKPFARNQSLKIGDPLGPQKWEIMAPFGLELVSVIASKDKLFSQSRADTEQAATYINDLRQALPQNVPNKQTTVDFYLITTRSRQ